MSESNANAHPWPGQVGRAAETTPGSDEPVKWVVIRANLSPGEAVVIRGRLESEGIPAVLQQEALGAVLGLTVGPLGSARVFVPEPLAEQALAILAETFEVEDDTNEG
jgi:hypothetical protein